MSKERYNQIIDEAYDSFGDKVDEMWQKSDVGDLDDFIYDKLLFSGYNEKGEWFARLISKEEYIYNCKTDNEFSERWGLKIQERELSLEERLELVDKINTEIRQDLYSYAFNNPIYTGGVNQRPDDVERHELLSDLNIPTKIITITYNNETIEVYE